MLINPYDLEKGISDDFNKEDINIEEIQKNIILKYNKELNNEKKEKLSEKIKLLLINNYNIKDNDKIKKICDIVISNMFGYGILQKYIENENITDIRVVRYDYIYIKEKGKWKRVNDSFNSNKEFEEYIRYIILKNNSNINFDTPIVVTSDKKYNLRIEAGIFPVNSISANLVIRIHRPNNNISLESLFVIDEMLDAKSYKLINKMIYENKNIILAGKGGSGKTTLLRAIIDKIPNDKSISINEETTELYIDSKNAIQREIVLNRENDKKITLEKLMKHSLVMSNDIIVVGELKGEEASVFIDSISTGHVGLATVHSDSIYNVLNRLIILFKRDEKTSKYSEDFVRTILSNSLDYIIYLKEYKVVQIAKIENNTLNLLYDKGAMDDIIL